MSSQLFCLKTFLIAILSTHMSTFMISLPNLLKYSSSGTSIVAMRFSGHAQTCPFSLFCEWSLWRSPEEGHESNYSSFAQLIATQEAAIISCSTFSNPCNLLEWTSKAISCAVNQMCVPSFCLYIPSFYMNQLSSRKVNNGCFNILDLLRIGRSHDLKPPWYNIDNT